MNEAIKNGKGILLGIDFGDKRTGVAVSDMSRFLASARETVTVSGLNDCAEKMAAMAKNIDCNRTDVLQMLTEIGFKEITKQYEMAKNIE